MWYVPSSVGSSYEPKLLGTYELELARSVQASVRTGFARVVDVGAAEGYYAVGMALAIPGVQVVAFEANPAGRELLCRMADLNGVRDRILVHGVCDVPALQRWIDPASRTLLIMDVEGAEKKLLDPDLLPALRTVHVIVEIHDYADPEIGDVIRARFRQTHQIEEINVKRRLLGDYPIAVPWLFKTAARGALVNAIDEHRHPDSYWLWMLPVSSE
jgi:predicted RNA methylase